MKRVDQLVNGDQAVFFRDIRQMGITCGCIWTGVAEQRLDMTKA